MLQQSSSQSATVGIPLDHAPSGSGYKLLELPPELLALLESDNPPTLRLESTPTAGLLRTPDNDDDDDNNNNNNNNKNNNSNKKKTWSLRQKNTSNALILLQATQARTLQAIATVHETIELVPEAENAAAPTVAVKGKWHERFGRTR